MFIMNDTGYFKKISWIVYIKINAQNVLQLVGNNASSFKTYSFFESAMPFVWVAVQIFSAWNDHIEQIND